MQYKYINMEYPDDELMKLCHDPGSLEETELEILNNKYKSLQKNYEELNEKYNLQTNIVEGLTTQIEQIKHESNTLKNIITQFSKLLEQ